MDAVATALVGGVAQLQAVIASGQGSGPLFRVRATLRQ